MAIITFNGVTIKEPTTMEIEHSYIIDGDRNASGTLIADLVTTKDKINLSWSILTPSELKVIREQLANFFVTVTYINPQTNASRTTSFYSGAIKSGIFKYNTNTGLIDYYTGVTVNLVET